jgi:hypothetical protein
VPLDFIRRTCHVADVPRAEPQPVEKSSASPGSAGVERARSLTKEPAMYIGFGFIIVILAVVLIVSMMRRSRV